MPRARGSPATQEEYEEWLGRVEEKEELSDQWDLFQSTLRSELYDYNDAQIEKLWELKGVKQDYAEHGIYGINIEYPWGTERRYGVQGMPGLWGWERVQEIMAEEVE